MNRQILKINLVGISDIFSRAGKLEENHNCKTLCNNRGTRFYSNKRKKIVQLVIVSSTTSRNYKILHVRNLKRLRVFKIKFSKNSSSIFTI